METPHTETPTTKPPAVSNGTRFSRSVTVKRGSKFMPTPYQSLRASLPTGWESYFNTRRAGRNYGLEIKCWCGEKPPQSIYGVNHPMYNYQKWRWLSVHLAGHTKADALKARRIQAAEKRRTDKHKRAA
jgi:hypothetical protein